MSEKRNSKPSPCRTALYAGSFDPVTNGHLDIIERASRQFDSLIVAIACNIKKQAVFSVEERLHMLGEAIRHLDNIELDAFEGLLVDYMKRKKALVLIRGLRAVSDFEYEFQMVHMNKRLYPEMETFFMMTGEDWFYLSSQIVKEVARFGGSIKGLVPPVVEKMLARKFNQKP